MLKFHWRRASTRMIRLLIADDHALFRAGLRKILLESGDIGIVDEAGDGPESLLMLGQAQYDLILLDISMPGQSGVEILKQIKSIKPEQAVLVLSMHPESQYALRVLRAGASGYIVKESTPEELVSAVKKVANGGKYISAALSEELVLRLNSRFTAPRHEQLSDREYQVMILLASGNTLREIAGYLSLSPKTIGTYRSRIHAKMNTRTDAELTNYVIQRDLL